MQRQYKTKYKNSHVPSQWILTLMYENTKKIFFLVPFWPWHRGLSPWNWKQSSLTDNCWLQRSSTKQKQLLQAIQVPVLGACRRGTEMQKIAGNESSQWETFQGQLLPFDSWTFVSVLTENQSWVFYKQPEHPPALSSSPKNCVTRVWIRCCFKSPKHRAFISCISILSMI